MRTAKQLKPKNTNIGNSALLLGSIILILLLIEIGLRLSDLPKTITSGWKGRGNWTKNQLGFRGQSIDYDDKDYVIVLLGDSQVEADALSQNAIPESRLQHYLNSNSQDDISYKVFTVGTSGYGQDQQLLMLKEYFKTFRADLVLLWFTPGNDIWNNMFPTHWPHNGHPKPTFRLVNNKLTGPNVPFGASIFSERLRITSLMHRAFIRLNVVNRPAPLNDTHYEMYLPAPYKPLSKHDGPICFDWQQKWDNGTMFHENLGNEKSHLAFSLSPRSQRMEYGINLTTALLQEIENLSADNQAKFVTFYKAIFNTTNECDANKVYHSLNDKYYLTTKMQFDANMQSLIKEKKAIHIPVRVYPWMVSPTDAHLNNKANDALMMDLSIKLHELTLTNK